jgi:gamma-glutamylcyclotransferase (GGCT)/AIG2-like uncharacterized protein YtfP
VYGSLLFPEVMRTLVDREPRRFPATVDGWRVIALPGVPYPGLAPDPATTAAGDLLPDLSPDERELLDAFEDPQYDLVRVHCDTATGTSTAWAYGLTAPVPPAPAWDREAFGRDHLDRYVAACARWRRHHEQRRSAPVPDDGSRPREEAATT